MQVIQEKGFLQKWFQSRLWDADSVGVNIYNWRLIKEIRLVAIWKYWVCLTPCRGWCMCKTQSCFLAVNRPVNPFSGFPNRLRSPKIPKKTPGSNCTRLSKNNSIKNKHSSLILAFSRREFAFQVFSPARFLLEKDLHFRWISQRKKKFIQTFHQ